MKLVLDTNIYSDYAEGLPVVVDFLAIHGEDILLPSIVLGELSYGFMKGSRQRFNEKKLQEFIRIFLKNSRLRSRAPLNKLCQNSSQNLLPIS